MEHLQEFFGLTNEELEREATRRREILRDDEQRQGMYLNIWNILLGIDTHGATDRFTLERFFRRHEARVVTEMLTRPFSDDLYEREHTLRTVIHMLLIEEDDQLPKSPPHEKVRYIVKEISNEESVLSMKDECCICMEKHTLNSIIQGPCGHQIGKVCFEQWSKMCVCHVTCPLCRIPCVEVIDMMP